MALLLTAVLSQADPSRDAFRALLRLRDAEGSWSSERGDRGRALVAFFSAGWSDLSKEEIDDIPLGPLLGRELSRIEAGQRDDGLFFPDDPTANAWTALALTEAYGLTGSERRRLPARRAAEAVQGMPASDEGSLFWQYRVRASAHFAGLFDRGPEPPPLEGPLRRDAVARWWGGTFDAPLPDPLDRAAPEEIYLADLTSARRSGHGAWQRKVVDVWSRRKEPANLETAAFRALSLIPCNCYGCRSPFRKD